MRKKADIIRDLKKWASRARRPAVFRSEDPDLEFSEEDRRLAKLETIDAQDLTRAHVRELWWSFQYLSKEGLAYFLPSILALSLEKELFPMIELTPYEILLWGVDDATGEPNRSLEETVAMLSSDQRCLLCEYFLWQARYRGSENSGIRRLLRTEAFRQLFPEAHGFWL